ncbi:MAG: aminotransferase class V-fold PLP-dependent enzyme [Firmicutes bacterium]|nr:aminotransferase class V-fold PLP-dependent enzyme [Bacillota bacterium]
MKGIRDLTAFRADFPALSRGAYLQTGAVGLVPGPVLQQLDEWTRCFYADGPTTPSARRLAKELLNEARHRASTLVGCAPEEIAWVENVTSGIDSIALGLEWKPGDEVIVASTEHFAGRAPWRLLAERKGVAVKVVEAGPDTGWRVLPAAVEAALSPRTRLICLSDVSFCTGIRLECREIASLAGKQGILFILDGAQAAGILPVDVHELGCDAYAFPGYKWCLAPEGTAALYLSPKAARLLKPHRAGYHGTSRMDMDGNFNFLEDARMVQGTTFNWLAFAAWGASLAYLEDAGFERIRDHALGLADRLAEGLGRLPGVNPVRPAERRACSSLVPWEPADLDPAETARYLQERHAVTVRSLHRPKALRASLHLYNDLSDVQRLLAGMEQALKGIPGSDGYDVIR